jgi:phycocyanobilin:ferredoxin oxidoreductase
MIEIFPQAKELSNKIISKLQRYTIDEIDLKYHHSDLNFTWENYLWTDKNFRRAHVEIVDASESKKMWVMHVCIFPHYNCPDPIFGFDIVCGKNKITGAFHDFSVIGESQMNKWYSNKMSQIEWNKPRELPDWAKRIFSPNMLAAGNIQTQEELDQLFKTVIDNLDYYLYNVGVPYSDRDFKEQHNNYCKNQKMNPHTPAMMINFGIEKETFMKFMDDVLFVEAA